MADALTRVRTLSPLSWFALFVILVAYPAVYSSGIMGPLVRAIIVEGSRTDWWQFWWANMAFHWIPFVLVWWVVTHSREGWISIGLDWNWLWRKRWWWAVGGGGLVAAAIVMPALHYGDTLPPVSHTIFLAPVSTGERLWVIWGAITAGVTEEVLFRGFAITRLTRFLGSAWAALPVSVVAFVFIHGTPRDVEQFFTYAMAGLAFGVPFILMGCRRLELLIALHVGIDASMVVAP